MPSVAAPPSITDTEAIEIAKRAFQRRRKMVAAELKLGLGTLSTIASSAPFIGLVGTVFGIMNAFGQVGMQKSAYMAWVASNLGESLVTTAMGLVVAVLAVWCRNSMRTRMEIFESEMSNAALEMVTYLNAHRQWRNQPVYEPAESASLLFSPPQASPVYTWEVLYDRQRALLLAMWCCALFVAFTFASAMYSSFRWYQSQIDYPTWEQFGGQQSVSPDRRYRALVPVLSRWRDLPSGNGQHPPWSCENPSVVLRIVSNDRPPTWKSHLCGEETRYDLEPDEALLAWSCNVVPLVMWRTNDEVLIECDNCSTDNVQLVELDAFPGRIAVLGPGGKRIHLQVVHPQPGCFE
jgi:MotA/TolQ/ExbB proton channel family